MCWKGLQCRPRSVSTCALIGVTWWELQNDLTLVAIYDGLGGSLERLCSELRQAYTSARLGILWWISLVLGFWLLESMFQANIGHSL